MTAVSRDSFRDRDRDIYLYRDRDGGGDRIETKGFQIWVKVRGRGRHIEKYGASERQCRDMKRDKRKRESAS
jgi:hypothetical protein